MHRVRLRLAGLLPHHIAVIETIVLVIVIFFASSGQAYAVTRLLNRSLYVASSQSGATTDYTITFTHNTIAQIGSVDMLFCIDPIPYMPCDAPAGLDLSQATLTDQSGETGYNIVAQSANHIVLGRPPVMVGSAPSSYTFHNVKNPTYMGHSFGARLSTYASSDASGSIIDLGSVLTQATESTRLETQVPPILIFCMAEQVTPDCAEIGDTTYTDMGTLSTTDTLRATTQMGVGTNASDGFVITVNGTTMAAGTRVINELTTPTASEPGKMQFGLNLRANANPAVGSDPDGDSANAVPMPNYDTPDKFMYKDGDIVAASPNVSLIRRFTVSYIVNAPASLRAGTYTTSLTYICTGRF
jgi:hypothetical protein